MALIKCKECKTEISNQAKSCPQCGAKSTRKKTSTIAWVVLAIIFISIIISRIINTPSETADTTSHQTSSTPSNNAPSIRSSNTNVDPLISAYLNRKVYENPIQCKIKIINNYEIASCIAIGIGTKTVQALWLVNDGKYLAINGTARSLVDEKLKGIQQIGLHPLPLPKDMDIATILKTFE